MGKHEEVKGGTIFPMGDKNEILADYFIGDSYLNKLVNDPKIAVGVSNVTFEPATRNNWHIHRNGFQILLVTGGEGWYQEEGKEAQPLQTGDTVVVYQDVKHWHGAMKDSWFEHLSISSGTIEWLEPVTDKVFNNLEY